MSENCRNNSITCIAPTKTSQATYLVWLDCRKMQGCAAEFTGYLREHTGLYLSEGRQYGENGNSFIRMNIACPRSRLEDGMKRLAEGVELYMMFLNTQR